MERLQKSELALDWLKKQILSYYTSLWQNNLWKRMVRNVLATTLTVGICLIRYDSSPPFGKAAYIAAMVTIFVHPGRRVGQLIEALSLALLGGFIGIAWGLLGLYLSSLIMIHNPSAAYSIRALFLVIALMVHGFFRSHTPRVMLAMLLLIIECLSALTTTAVYVTTKQVQQLSYPVLLSALIILTINIFILPEFSSAFLGKTVIEALANASAALAKAGQYFVESDELDSNPETEAKRESATYTKHRPAKIQQPEDGQGILLANVTATKKSLRHKLSACRSAQSECQFEIAWSHLPPYAMSPISKEAMKRLTRHVIAVIGTCETRFALLGDKSSRPEPIKDSGEEERIPSSTKNLAGDPTAKGVDLDLLKPKREIEFCDVKLLRYLLERIKKPYVEFHSTLMQSVDVVIACLAFAYDVPQSPSSARPPAGITMEELKVHQETLESALRLFDTNSAAALEGAAAFQDLKSEDLDVMPREELFLIASFLLNVREAATQVQDMLHNARHLVQHRTESTGRKKLFLPRIDWWKWLYSDGAYDESIPAVAKRAGSQKSSQSPYTGLTAHNSETSLDIGVDYDVESAKHEDTAVTNATGVTPGQTLGCVSNESKHNDHSEDLSLWLRGKAADLLEWVQHSEDLSYAFKLTIATFLVAFPAFVPSLNAFYYHWRGTWAALQLIFVFDVAIGTSINNFIIRASGTTLGSLWGWAAYEARDGNPFVCTAMIFVGLIPFNYVLLNSKYSKTGTVGCVSLCVVAMATELQTVPGSGTVNFLNRWLAFLIGGAVALIVEVLVLPVKARTRLTEALATAIKHIGRMESCISYGVETGVSLKAGFPPSVFERYDRASNKANSALSSAEVFFPFCGKEPRLKGAWSSISGIYEEMIFVLHQIVDKMDNMIQLRLSFGSGPLEEFNAQIYQYRRNVAGAIYLVLYAVHEALTTKYPLPQFVPSARLAHLRLINRVREIILESVIAAESNDTSDKALRRTMRRKYMSWSASAAAQVEVIEYLEELTNLAKLLIGANEFRGGVLHRPTLPERLHGSTTRNDGKRTEDVKVTGMIRESPFGSKMSRRHLTEPEKPFHPVREQNLEVGPEERTSAER